MIPAHHWTQSFQIKEDDIDELTNLLLEGEVPLSSEELATALVNSRLKAEAASLKKRFEGAKIYNPAHSYEIGDRLVFSSYNYATGHVVDIRPGDNETYRDFRVITVEFEVEVPNMEFPSEFAVELTVPHQLSSENKNGADPLSAIKALSAEEIIASAQEEIINTLEKHLEAADDLVEVAGKWFPHDLMLEANDGHLNLAEAVLDLADGGPLSTVEIVDQIGGLGNAPEALQVFSLNYALNQNSRFDEVGPSGEVLWFLTRLEPPEVLETPNQLRYSPIDYDRGLLAPEMLALEAEIGDELSAIDQAAIHASGKVTIIYPHRRLGLLPLNAATRPFFPTARQAPRVWVRLVDGQDGEEFPGWVVRENRYVYGLDKFYRKHRLPVGAYITVQAGEEPEQVVVDYVAYRPRTEWVLLMSIKNDQLEFENGKRAIGASYDDLMILGIDDLASIDEFIRLTQLEKRSLTSILRTLLVGLGRLTPQGTVHAKTLYSAVNVVRRCPPGPIFATLVANPEFQDVGDHYWKLRTP